VFTDRNFCKRTATVKCRSLHVGWWTGWSCSSCTTVSRTLFG